MNDINREDYQNAHQKTTDYEDNLKYYSDLQQFYKTLLDILYEYPMFIEVQGIESFRDMPGIYMICMEKTQEFMVGCSEDVAGDVEKILEGVFKDSDDFFERAKVFVYINESQNHVDYLYDNVRSIIPDTMLVERLTGCRKHFGGESEMTRDDVLYRIEQMDKKTGMLILASLGTLAVAGVVAGTCGIVRCLVGRKK